MTKNEQQHQRVYVGGLDPSGRGLRPSMVAGRIKSLLKEELDICHIDIRSDDVDTFFFVDARIKKDETNPPIVSENVNSSALNVIAKKFNNVKWKGCRLKVEGAKPHFLKRLEEERRLSVVSKLTIPGTEPAKSCPPSKSMNYKPPRQLRIRQRYGTESFHVDTKPRRVTDWKSFRSTQQMVQRKRKRLQQSLVSVDQPQLQSAHARKADKQQPEVVNMRRVAFLNRSIHLRFNEEEDVDIEEGMDDRDGDDETDSSSDSDVDDDESESGRDPVQQPSKAKSNGEKPREEDVQVRGYQWSDYSSSDESEDGDGEADKDDKNTSSLGQTIDDNDYGGGVDDDEYDRMGEGLAGGSVAHEEKSDDNDLMQDVSSNLGILAQLFPEMTETVAQQQEDLSQESKLARQKELERKSTERSKRRGDEDGSEDDDIDHDGSFDDGDKMPVPSSTTNTFMQRYDPTQEASRQQFELQNKNDCKEATPSADKEADQNVENPSMESNHDDQSSRTGSSEDDTSDDDKNRQDAENREDTQDVMKSETSENKEQHYEEKKLENIFKEARGEVIESEGTNLPGEERGGGAFSFGFDLSSTVSRPGSTQPSAASGFQFGFALESTENMPEDSKVKVLDKPEDDDEDGGVLETPTQSKHHDSVLTRTDGFNGNQGMTDKQKPEKPRRRGILFPETVLDAYTKSFLALNEGEYIARDPEGFKYDTEIKQQWKKERESLTLDWKRKRKQALARRQKKMKYQHR